jgi:predicted DNA-binding transcriptional regulator AlpA
MSDRLIIDWRGLKRMGWPFSRAHTWRMMKASVFPQACKLGDHRNSHPVWRVKEVLAYFESHGLKVTEDWTTPALGA